MTLHPIALERLNIAGKWSWRKPYTYDNLEWLDEEVAKPTEAELQAAWDAFQSEGGFEMERLRTKRNQLLAETDWVTLKALDLSNDGLGIQLEQVWVQYRQALRDLPANTTDPANPVWPIKPGSN